MPKVMQARRSGLAGRTDYARLTTQALKYNVDGVIGAPAPGPGREEPRSFPFWQWIPPPKRGKDRQLLDELGADWHQPGFVELGVADGHDAVIKVDVAQGQSQSFANA
jgi:hypothetical protein